MPFLETVGSTYYLGFYLFASFSAGFFSCFSEAQCDLRSGTPQEIWKSPLACGAEACSYFRGGKSTAVVSRPCSTSSAPGKLGVSQGQLAECWDQKKAQLLVSGPTALCQAQALCAPAPQLHQGRGLREAALLCAFPAPAGNSFPSTPGYSEMLTLQLFSKFICSHMLPTPSISCGRGFGEERLTQGMIRFARTWHGDIWRGKRRENWGWFVDSDRIREPFFLMYVIFIFVQA